VVAHLFAYGCTANVYLGVAWIDTHGFFEQFVCKTEVVFFNGDASLSDIRLGSAGIEAFEFYEAGFCVG